MGITIGNQGRLNAPARRPWYLLLTLVLLAAAVGCGTHKTDQASTDSPSTGESSELATSDSPSTGESTQLASVTAPAGKPSVSAARGGRAEPVHRITLTDKRCIRFEPQWTDVRVGQSVTWHSELSSPMTIYVSPGVFARDHFLVRPGSTVSSGPVRTTGRFSFWTEPAACRDAPRGVLLAGPGVRVQETFYASTPGPR